MNGMLVFTFVVYSAAALIGFIGALRIFASPNA